MTARLVSVNVGMPKDVPWNGKTVHTGIWKTPVEGPVMVRRLNIDGDGQGDLAGHGGEQRAVMVYQTESYDYWQDYLGRDDLQPGNFGENFTVSGLDDRDVCIGDRYRIGEAEFEVTQPRVTCFRVGMRLGVPEMPNLLVSQHRPGFYFRVITEGLVRAGDDIVLTRRGRHELSVADVDALLYLPDRDMDLLRKIVEVPALSPGWQQSFRDMLVEHEKPVAPTQLPIGCRTRMARVPAATRDGHPSGEPDGAVDPARGRRRRRPSDAASRAVPHREDPRRRRSAADAQLLAVRRSRSGVLPHQRQTRGPRTGQPMAAQPCQSRIDHRIRRATRRFLPRRRQQPGHPGVCRHRRHPRHGHGARVGRGEEPAPDLVAAYDAEHRDACVRRRGHCPARLVARRSPAGLLHPWRRRARRVSIGSRSPRWACRPTRRHTSAVPLRSWTTCVTPSPRPGSIPRTSTPNCSAPCRRSTPAWSARRRQTATPSRRRAGAGAADHLRPQRAQRQLVARLPHPPRIRGGVRRANPVFMPKRCLPHVRDRR